MPDGVTASAINKWLFNEDTVDKVLRYLMENAHYVQGGDRLAKTIIFGLHTGGPDALFAGKDTVIQGLFDALEKTEPRIASAV